MAGRNWYEKLLRIEPGVSIAQWAWDRVTGNWHWILAVAGSGGMTILAGITEWLEAWGPIGWGAIGLASFLVVLVGGSIVRYLSSKRRVKTTEAHAIEKWSQHVDDINPLAPEFHTKVLSPTRVAHPITNRVVRKRFIDCEFIGPANILFIGDGTMADATFHDCDIIVIKTPARLHNVTVFDGCNVFGGNIWRCSIFILPEMIPVFQAMGAPFATLTGNPEIDGQVPQGTEA